MALKSGNSDGMRPQPPSIQDPPTSSGIRTPMRPQPPTMKNPPANESKPWEPGQESESEVMASDDDEDDKPENPDQPDWEKRAKDAYSFSTTYIDSNYRSQWDDSLRAFNNQHASDSKYNSESYRKRSHLYVPVTRTVIRKNEAAACQAFFSNQDLISITAMNEAEKPQVLSAAIMKQLIQYRLTKTIPWFKIIIGGLQDAQKQPAAVARIKWVYETKQGRDGQRQVCKDEPHVDLIPIENLRIDPSANWLDPINTSPYLIELMPMFIGDIKEKMTRADPKGRKWRKYPDHELKRSESNDDSTRQARLNNQQDPNREKRDVSDYDIAWVQRHIHRWDGTDWEFYTLHDGRLLTDPELLENTVFHGLRDYVLGFSHIETHKVFPDTIPALVKPLQDGINGIENQRTDNVMLVLNKRHLVRRGANVDTASLVRNVPGGVTSLDNLETDYKEQSWQDVTQSSYQEAGAKRQAFDELIGNFNPMQMADAVGKNIAQGSMRMLQNPSMLMTEFMLMTFAITFVCPIIRQLVLLEQHYETDKVILGIAGQKAQAFQKFGVNEVTDEMLDHELTTQVNVGMGATDPIMKLNRLITALSTYANLSKAPPAGLNLTEVMKELMALSGYQDGERFGTGQNPEMAKLEQINKQLMMALQDAKRHKQDKDQGNVLKFMASREKNHTQLQIAGVKHDHEKVQTLAQHYLDQDDMILKQALTPPPQPGQGGSGGAQSQGASVPAVA